MDRHGETTLHDALVYVSPGRRYKLNVDEAARIARALPGVTVSAAGSDRLAYSRDLWPRRLIDVRAGRAAEQQPAAVLWPRSVEEVAAIVSFARSEGIPLVPFGAGSGVCGGIQPDARTLVVDLKKIADHRVVPDAPLVDVGAGALGITLEEDLGRQGYTIGHYPSSILCSTVGGWVAARGAGQCSGLYGKIEDMVASLECVLGTGEVVRLRRRRSAPDLTPLVIGSEGTLAIVTRAELRLHPKPAARAFAAFSFSSIVEGWEALRELFQSGLRPAVSRLYDPIDSRLLAQGSVKKSVRPKNPSPRVSRRRGPSPLASVLRAALRVPAAVNAAIEAMEGNLLGGCTLVLVFEGDDTDVHADAQRANGICARAGGVWLGEGPARAWLAHRYGVSYRQAPIFRLGAFSDTMEVAAPWSRLERLYNDVRHALGEHVVVLAHLSHAYPDGCSIYFTFSGAGRDDDAALAIYEHAWRDALAAAIAAGGTLSHHHGVGRSKAPRLGDELGIGIELVQGLMRAWDPAAILNPGNLAPRTPPGAERRLQAQVDLRAPLEVDEQSLLVDVPGALTVGEAEATLERRGMSLGVDVTCDRTATLAHWLAAGAPGSADPWSDPVAQLVAGLAVRLPNGQALVIRAAPRRAVGPDLRTLFVGAGQRLGVIERATLCVSRAGASPARRLPFAVERDPPLSEGESTAWERVVSALRDAPL